MRERNLVQSISIILSEDWYKYLSQCKKTVSLKWLMVNMLGKKTVFECHMWSKEDVHEEASSQKEQNINKRGQSVLVCALKIKD